MENNLENLWQRINTWGVIIGILGILVSAIGLIVGLLTLSWIVFQVGVIVFISGVITWIVPFIHVTMRLKKVNQYAKNILKEEEERRIQGAKYFQTGKELLINKNDIEALKYFDQAIEYGFEGEVYENRGICLQALGYDIDALNDFNKAILKSDKDANLYYLRSLSRDAIGDIEGSVDDLKKAVDLSKIPNEMNDNYNVTIKDKGWNSITDFYKAYLMREEDTLMDAIRERNMSEKQKENIWGNAKGDRTYPHWKKINKKIR